MKHLYFIRHGLSEMNAAGKLSGAGSDTSLTPDGRAQAKAAGVAAKHLGIDYIISSPLTRAHDTAKIVAIEIGFPADKIELNSLLLERHFGSLEGSEWDPDLNLDGISDVETRESVLERALLTLEHLQTLNADNILVSSHGTFGRALRHTLRPNTPYKVTPASDRFPNGQIIQLL
jgi:probable phosphoglycerate mutase